MPVQYIDLSHTIFDGLITYKGLPPPVVCDFLSREKSRTIYDDGSEFQIGEITMVANTGTYIDCPFHRFSDGKDLSQMDVEAFADLEAVTIRVQDTLAIETEHFKNVKLSGKAVLIYTGWAQHWNTEKYFDNHPFLTAGAAAYLRNAGVKLVGIDSHNIDDTRSKSRPVHTALLAAGILIVEHLCNLDQLPDHSYTFSAVPPKFKGVGTFPVRAFAKVEG